MAETIQKDTKKGKKRLTIAQKALIESLKKQLGNITAACSEAGIERQSHYRWLEISEAYKEEYNQIGDIVLDFAENSLHRQIAQGNTPATIFFLKTKGKKRGFIERSEVELSGGVASFVESFNKAYEDSLSEE